MKNTLLFSLSTALLLGFFTAFYKFPFLPGLIFILPFLFILPRKRWLFWISLYLIFYLIGGYYFNAKKERLSLASKEVFIKVLKIEPYYDQYKVLAESEGSFIEFTTKYSGFRPGDFCKITLKEKKGLKILNPYTPSLEERLIPKGLEGEYKLDERKRFYCTLSEAGFIEALRYKLFQFSENLSPLSRGLFLALVLGVDTQLPKEYLETLKNQGLYHQLAISGFNLAVLYGFLYKFWRWFLPHTVLIRMGFPIQLWSYLFSLPGAGLILIFSGFQPPALRAFVFLTFLILSKLLFRNTESLFILFLTATLLVIFDPALIGSLSFQLSFLATLSLIIGDILLKNLLFDSDEPSFLKKILLKTLYGLGLSLIVSLFTLPFLIYINGEFSLATPLNNLLATPFWSFIFIPLSILSAMLALVSQTLATFIMERVGDIFSLYIQFPLFNWIFRSSLPVNLFLLWLFFLFLLGAVMLYFFVKRWIKIFCIALLSLLTYFSLSNLYKRTSFVFIPKELTQQALLIKDQGDFYLIVKETPESKIERSYILIPILKKLGVNNLKTLLFLSEEGALKDYQKAFDIEKTYTLSDYELFEDLRLFKAGTEFIPLQRGQYLFEFKGLTIFWDEVGKDLSLPGVEVYYKLRGKSKEREGLFLFEKGRFSATFLFPEDSYLIIWDEKDKKISFWNKLFFPLWVEPSKGIAYRGLME
ncbi:hypothetical protein THC_0304 [Caldimicrobium thiodismutans]|uniref:ComEC/Rec2-related protein domain-containing protein n=1 Tax=Caldimicrobium thiodismutans TaxID=1653476 RepID=A0A0U5AVX5_9BACT|nr:ComEC/Rec2 family competence protein [Caldimicrobium thiodismutans]BAU22702.1 hypothetical protein THC_0304 [Caldimicrobium thiodismutans]